MERLKLIDLYQQRQTARKEKWQSDKRFRINPEGDLYLILTDYSKARGISARNMRTNRVEEFPYSLLVIPE